MYMKCKRHQIHNAHTQRNSLRGSARGIVHGDPAEIAPQLRIEIKRQPPITVDLPLKSTESLSASRSRCRGGYEMFMCVCARARSTPFMYLLRSLEEYLQILPFPPDAKRCHSDQKTMRPFETLNSLTSHLRQCAKRPSPLITKER